MPTRSPLISIENLRRSIGYIGVALPVTLFFGAILLGDCTGYQDSISIYYHTVVRNLFVGSLCAVAFFLIIYRGPKPIDNRITTAAGFMALGIAFFPTNPSPEEINACIRELIEVPTWTGKMHFVFAGSFFLLLTYLCHQLFTRTRSENHPTPEKLKRNKVYRISSYVMIGCVVILTVYFNTNVLSFLDPIKPVFILETIALWAFGAAWLVKGEVILTDKP